MDSKLDVLKEKTATFLEEQEKSRKNDTITIVGAREHNLKNVSVSVPKNSLVVITGPSGSGKSSLALDVLYTEGRRRYIESLSSYARQFLGNAKKPAVDRIDGLCPSIAIEQKTVGSNPRSTVGTITEVYDYLRVFFARVGQAHCIQCASPIHAHSSSEVAAMMLEKHLNTSVTVLAPIVRNRKGEFTKQLQKLFSQGYSRFRINGAVKKFKTQEEIETLGLKKTYTHTIDVILDQLVITIEERARLIDAVNKAFLLAEGRCTIANESAEVTYSCERVCTACALSFPDLEPRLFSFNSPIGACSQCEGIGFVPQWQNQTGSSMIPTHDFINRSSKTEETEENFSRPFLARCVKCSGSRLNQHARSVTIAEKSIFDLACLSVERLAQFFASLNLSKVQMEIVQTLKSEIEKRLKFLCDIGLSYLTLARSADSLSGGEGQRIRLATQLGSALSGVLYVLDEPSIGLHQRDNEQLIKTLLALRDHGNTVLVVEHDIDTMRASDYIIDMGPGAGLLGGQVTAAGTPEQLQKNKKSLTGAYLSGERGVALPAKRRMPDGFFTLENISLHNIKNCTVSFPRRVFCGVSGVSGSGKSTLIMDILVQYVKRILEESRHQNQLKIKNLVVIDQAPIGRTPRSNPATYLKIFDEIRKLFTALPESNARGYTPGDFSFNVGNGRCKKCSGDGSLTIEMHFLPAVTVQCDACNGSRYIADILEIKYKGKSIADILQMSAREALTFFAHHPTIEKRVALMCDVGLDYITLGQPATTLSGGEAQRIKLVDELAKRGTDTLYILDEPTTGLHMSDVERLLVVLNRLVDKGNTLIVIEHNLDVLKTVDYLIDLGPEGGEHGGTIVAHGTPEIVAKSEKSHTGRYLKQLLQK